MTERPSYMHPLCPVTMYTHTTDAPTCDRCVTHVARYLAWYEQHTDAERERIDAGAWFANSSTHARAIALRAQFLAMELS